MPRRILLVYKCIIHIVAGKTRDIISSRIHLSLTNTPEERGGKSVQGKLLDFDQYMNLVIRDAVELLDDNDHGSKRADSKLGTIILRADNILVIAIESPI